MGNGVGVSVGSEVSVGALVAVVAEGSCVSVGITGGVEGEQEMIREMQKAESRMRVTMVLCMAGILTEIYLCSYAGDGGGSTDIKTSRNVSTREGIFYIFVVRNF